MERLSLNSALIFHDDIVENSYDEQADKGASRQVFSNYIDSIHCCLLKWLINIVGSSGISGECLWRIFAWGMILPKQGDGNFQLIYLSFAL